MTHSLKLAVAREGVPYLMVMPCGLFQINRPVSIVYVMNALPARPPLKIFSREAVGTVW